MHDIKLIRDEPDAFDAGLKRRGLEPLAKAILELDSRRRAAQTRMQEGLARRNQASKEIGQAKAQKQDAAALMAEVARLKDVIAAAEVEEKDAAGAIELRLAEIPNLPAADVPDGKDETGNRQVRKWGEPKTFGFQPKEHYDLGEKLKLMEFARAAKISGARFTILTGQLARLERALGQFMIDLHTREFGYLEVSPPLLVRDNAVYGVGQLPKFKDDLFKATRLDPNLFMNWVNEEMRDRIDPPDYDDDQTEEEQEAVAEDAADREMDLYEQIVREGLEQGVGEQRYWLIPTAEVPLTNLVADEIVEDASLPHRYTALTACFRAEAGAAGKDTRGMLRQHQFYKVELVSIAHPDKSNDEHERMTSCAEEVLKRLGLPYRVMLLCTGDMGFASRKTYDIEVWLPGQNMYREISSCSNCGDFQARRMKARFKPAGGKGTEFVHTLNGSGIAVGRALIAVMENYQRQDGAIEVPEALRPYMGGIDVIGGAT
jgi:seryl-tRNA synthetase